MNAFGSHEVEFCVKKRCEIILVVIEKSYGMAEWDRLNRLFKKLSRKMLIRLFFIEKIKYNLNFFKQIHSDSKFFILLWRNFMITTFFYKILFLQYHYTKITWVGKFEDNKNAEMKSIFTCYNDVTVTILAIV